MNVAAYLEYMNALNFRDDDVVCVSFGKDKSWVGDFFQPFSTLKTESTIAKLAARNDAGQNIYISMAPFLAGTTSRKKEFVAGVRHVFADADRNGPEILANIKADAETGVMPQPAVGIESSPGKVQVIWHVNGDFDVAKQEALNRAIQARYNTDPATVDTARVLRVPGFMNHKYADKPYARVIQVGELKAHPLVSFNIEAAKAETKAPPTIKGDKIPYGQHDSELNRISGNLRRLGMEEEAIYDALVEVVEKRCENYGSDYLEMCRKHAHNICKKPVGKDERVFMNGKPIGESQVTTEGETQVSIQTLSLTEGDGFMSEKITPRPVLVRTITKKEPVFFGQSINQIFAWRGTGKTNLGLALTRAFATGTSFLNWEATKRSRVLYIEGEMPESQLQERWKQIVGKTDGYAWLVTIDKQPNHCISSLASEIGRQKVEATLAELESKGNKVDVLMLDSISTLFNLKANDEEEWIAVQAWLISLRSRGLTIFFFHHSGKAGLSRSHSKSEDMLDVSIKLEAPEDREEGILHAVLSYDKTRAGLSEPPADIKMRRVHSTSCPCQGRSLIGCPGDSVEWAYKPIQDAKIERAFQMFDEDASLGEVAKEFRVAKSTAQYWKSKWDAKRAIKGAVEPDARM